jgi:hypothetical protein
VGAIGRESGKVVGDAVSGPLSGVETSSITNRRSMVVDGATVVVVGTATDVVVAGMGARTVVVVTGNVVGAFVATVVVTRGSVVRGERRTVVVVVAATVVTVVVVVDEIVVVVDDVAGLGGPAGDGTLTEIDRAETSIAVWAFPALSVIENDPDAVSVAVTEAPPATAVESAVTVHIEDDPPVATDVIADSPAVSTKSADVRVEQSSASSPVTVKFTDVVDAVVGAVNVSVGAVASRVIVVVAFEFDAGPVLPTESAICPAFSRGMIVPDEHDDTVIENVVPDEALGENEQPAAVPAFSKSPPATPVMRSDIVRV